MDQDHLIEYYNSCDFFVAPSRFESFGIIFVEAMSCAKPVIACKVGGVTEVVGNAGLLIDVDDKKGLLECIVSLAKNNSLRSEIGQLARERYEANFSVKLMNKRLYQLLGEKLDEHQD